MGFLFTLVILSSLVLLLLLLHFIYDYNEFSRNIRISFYVFIIASGILTLIFQIFLIFHCYFISNNLTTYEYLKFGNQENINDLGFINNWKKFFFEKTINKIQLEYLENYFKFKSIKEKRVNLSTNSDLLLSLNISE